VVEATESPPLGQLLACMRENLPSLRERYGVRTLSVFGSYVRQEQKKCSDLDVLVEFDRTPTLLEFVDLQYHLRDLLGVKVDLVMKRALRPTLGRRILDELVPV